MELLKDIVAASRNIRQERKVDLKLVLKASLRCDVELERAVIESIGRVQFVEEAKGVAWPGAGFELEVELPEVSVEAVEAQRAKLRKDVEQLGKVICEPREPIVKRRVSGEGPREGG